MWFTLALAALTALADDAVISPARVLQAVPYADRDPSKNLLDVYIPAHAEGAAPLPILVWVHGGGWQKGSRTQLGADKERFFKAREAIIVSVDYRLSGEGADVDGTPIQHPDHITDVADAIRWVHDHAAELGGDPGRLALMGFSAGAHLVTLAVSDPRWLGELGADVRCVAALDIEALDIPSHLDRASPLQRSWSIYTDAFGDDPAVWRDASPITWIDPARRLPDLLLVRRGTLGRQDIVGRFAEAARSTGADVTVVDASVYDHEGVNRAIGEPGERVITPPLGAFLDTCLARR